MHPHLAFAFGFFASPFLHFVAQPFSSVLIWLGEEGSTLAAGLTGDALLTVFSLAGSASFCLLGLSITTLLVWTGGCGSCMSSLTDLFRLVLGMVEEVVLCRSSSISRSAFSLSSMTNLSASLARSPSGRNGLSFSLKFLKIKKN